APLTFAGLDDDDDLHISRPDLPAVEMLDTPVDDARDEAPTRSRARAGAVAAAILLVASAGLGYWFFVHLPSRAALASSTTVNAAAPSAPGPADPSNPDVVVQPAALDASALAGAPGGTSPVSPSAEASKSSGDESSRPSGSPAPPATGPADARASRERSLERVRQMAAAGQVPEAFAALSSVPGLSGAALGVEERRLAEAAREGAALARRAAADLRAGSTDAFLQG